MRYSKEHKAETHGRIVRNASVQLREKGPAGIGIADLMKESGLTHGGFYAHFESRDALIDEAFLYAIEQITRRWRKRISEAQEGDQLAAIVNSYLTPQHRDNVGTGCALPALSAEIVRADGKTRKAFSGRLEAMIDVVAGVLKGLPPKAARKQAAAIIATMMGSLSLARAAGTGELSNEILEIGRSAALALGNTANATSATIGRKARSRAVSSDGSER